MRKNHFLVPAILFLAIATFSCSEKESKILSTEPMTASAEFLFEGPNTLQGNFSLDMELLSSEIGIEKEQISAVRIETITVIFENDTVVNSVESALVQLVSNDLSLQSAGTQSTLSGKKNLLNVNKELDILGYIKDPSSQLIVDANLKTDMDELTVSVIFQLSVAY